MRFKDFKQIDESVAHITDLKKIHPHVKKMGTNPLLFRGMRLARGKNFSMNLVKNDRGAGRYMGKILDSQDGRMDAVLQGLGIESPIFTSTDSHKVELFGEVFVVIPKGKYTSHYSNMVQDLAFITKLSQDAETIVKSYKKGIIDNQGEIIIECKEYFIVAVHHMMRRAPLWIQKEFKAVVDRKMTYQDQQKKVYGTIKTYRDLDKFFLLYNKYIQWREKNL